LVRSGERNASVRLANPETIFIWEPMLAEIEGGKGDHVIAHEAWHGFDLQFGFSTQPAFMEFFERLASAQDHALFSFINESAFLGKDGGHAADDALECFASLMNTVTAPNWTERLEAADARTRGLYFHALSAAVKSFRKRRPEALESGFGQLLKSRLEALREMMAGDPPPLDELAELAVSTRLEALGVEVLGAYHLKKSLRHRSGLVLVYVFDERDRESLAGVEAAMRHFGSELNLVGIRYSEVTASELMSSRFRDRVSAPALYLFNGGRERYRGEIWDTKRHQEVIEAIAERLR